jgi:hypothetical protein
MINIFRFLCFIFLISIVFWYFEWKNSKIYQADQLSGYEKDSIIYSQNFEFKNSKIYQFYQLSGYEKEKIIYSQNYEYVINNNVAQYSSYIIEEKSDALYRIEVFAILNDVLRINNGGKESFRCILTISGNSFELDVIEIQRQFRHTESKKFIFKLYKKELKSRQNVFNLNDSKVALIWKPDFDHQLEFNEYKAFGENINKTRFVLSYSLIKFQKPTIIKPVEPRLPLIGFCVHYIYSFPLHLKNWIDIHLNLGAPEIVIYDATENNQIVEFIRINYGENSKITVRPYEISFDNLCNEKILFKQYKYLNLSNSNKRKLLELCTQMFENEFRNKYDFRGQHEQVTANDCLTVLQNKYEFIGYHDLDEFIFPRNFKKIQKLYSSYPVAQCNNLSSICKLDSFKQAFNPEDSRNNQEENYLYNYIQYLIEYYGNGMNISELRSIYFQHVGYLVSFLSYKRFSGSKKFLILYN